MFDGEIARLLFLGLFHSDVSEDADSDSQMVSLAIPYYQ